MFPWFTFVIYHHYPWCLEGIQSGSEQGVVTPRQCVLALMYGEELVLVWWMCANSD